MDLCNIQDIKALLARHCAQLGLVPAGIGDKNDERGGPGALGGVARCGPGVGRVWARCGLGGGGMGRFAGGLACLARDLQKMA